jgi:hypothetical protein
LCHLKISLKLGAQCLHVYFQSQLGILGELQLIFQFFILSFLFCKLTF